MIARQTVVLLAVLALGGTMKIVGSGRLPDDQQNAQNDEALRKLEALKKERKESVESSLREAAERLRSALVYSVEDLQLVLTLKVRERYGGSQLISDESDPRYLGTVADEFEADSIFNQFGRFGSEFATSSIWNQFGRYGGQFSTTSPFNPFSSRGPVLMKNGKAIGRLTVNKFVAGAVDPGWLRSFYVY